MEKLSLSAQGSEIGESSHSLVLRWWGQRYNDSTGLVPYSTTCCTPPFFSVEIAWSTRKNIPEGTIIAR